MVPSPPSLEGSTAIVVGGGVAGLAAAIVLGRRGATVTVLERDAPADADCEAYFLAAKRAGAPQVRHSHVFLGRLRSLLRADYPVLLRELMAAGARELNGIARPPQPLRGLAHEPGDDDLIALGCRRTTFEWVLRHHVARLPNVRWQAGGRVVGLLGVGGPTPTVAGVRYACNGGEQPLYAHLVVDASGRRSEAPRWLAELGGRPVRERLEPSGIVYYTRFYRLLDGAEEPVPGADPFAADLDWLKYAVFIADERTFSITLAVPLAEPRLKVLADARAFDTLARMIPGLAQWLHPDVSAPIDGLAHEVQAMGGLINRLRRFVDGAGPVALRFAALGDAAYCTNPLYGRGCTQAFLHAHFLGEALDEAHGDWPAIARALDRRAHAVLEPFYRASVIADRDAVRRAEGQVPKQWQNRLRARFFRDGMTLALRHDPVVYRAFLRMMNMIETPGEAFARPEVALRCLWFLAWGDHYRAMDPDPTGPERINAIERCEAAAAVSPRRKPASA